MFSYQLSKFTFKLKNLLKNIFNVKRKRNNTDDLQNFSQFVQMSDDVERFQRHIQ